MVYVIELSLLRLTLLVIMLLAMVGRGSAIVWYMNITNNLV